MSLQSLFDHKECHLSTIICSRTPFFVRGCNSRLLLPKQNLGTNPRTFTKICSSLLHSQFDKRNQRFLAQRNPRFLWFFGFLMFFVLKWMKGCGNLFRTEKVISCRSTSTISKNKQIEQKIWNNFKFQIHFVLFLVSTSSAFWISLTTKLWTRKK